MGNKAVGVSQEVAAHVDGMGQFDGATIWIALEPSNRDNGCLCYIKGSHRKLYTSSDLKACNEETEGATCVEAQPGDAVIHSARTVHWSRKSQSSDRERRAVSFFY